MRCEMMWCDAKRQRLTIWYGFGQGHTYSYVLACTPIGQPQQWINKENQYLSVPQRCDVYIKSKITSGSNNRLHIQKGSSLKYARSKMMAQLFWDIFLLRKRDLRPVRKTRKREKLKKGSHNILKTPRPKKGGTILLPATSAFSAESIEEGAKKQWIRKRAAQGKYYYIVSNLLWQGIQNETKANFEKCTVAGKNSDCWNGNHLWSF